ncbi:alpha-ketoglutarate-dependent dioxygenase AlkB family protein [Flavobacterium sp.]|uniref:alpha-ketoglutarate-dependent dioxygenase AlkB family protein n=1 Tax=Flavobacterium sp. TaxID=239 RepID=UPI0028BD38A7|nr:alpha-ketoglutarate-dependent dioxygenase AlkB [Flavobacterium sp.]
MNPLFENNTIILNLPDAEIEYTPTFFSEKEAKILFEELLATVPWQQDIITIFGKNYNQPRLTCFYGDFGLQYTYSGITMNAIPWNKTISEIKQRVENHTQQTYNSVLINLYRDGKDSNGWHADDEKTLGQNPVIASISLGEKRPFQLKHKIDSTVKKTIELESGSLLLMKGTTQHYWKHQIPKTVKPINPRINLTFRTIFQNKM